MFIDQRQKNPDNSGCSIEQAMGGERTMAFSNSGSVTTGGSPLNLRPAGATFRALIS
jgi:hypothetical protein